MFSTTLYNIVSPYFCPLKIIFLFVPLLEHIPSSTTNHKGVDLNQEEEAQTFWL